jgi:hypothetical protein
LFKSLSVELQANLNKIKEDFLQICMENIEIGVEELKKAEDPYTEENA